MTRPPELLLIDRTLACLKSLAACNPPAQSALSNLAQYYDTKQYREPRHSFVNLSSLSRDELFENAVASISDKRLLGLREALINAKDRLHWKVDDGGYYYRDADVGDAYKNGNVHALLIGPENSVVQADDVLLGFFLLSPHTLYRDHRHVAPELYIPLTGPSGWRFDFGPWQDHQAGDVIYNPANKIHATRVDDIPFLSVFVWTNDINERCEVVPSPDWGEIESLLQKEREKAF